MSTPMTLAAALDKIPPKRSHDAFIVLTLCCAHLQSGESMPPALRRWLDRYLTAERAKIKNPRSLQMANLATVLEKAKAEKARTGRRNLTGEQRRFADALGFDESAVKKWRRKSNYPAVVAVSNHLHEWVVRQQKGKN